MNRVSIVLLGAITITMGCNNDAVCTTEGAWGISIRVRDASTGLPAAFGATLVARDGAYADSATGLYNGPDEILRTYLQVALNRVGTYDVTVKKPGFQTWSRQALRVEPGECRVEGVTLNANLEPANP